MKKKLFLFTDSYPYGTSESFLTLELNYLATKFEKIYLIPQNNGTTIREIPENVCLLEIPEKKSIRLHTILLNNFNIIFVFIFEILKSKNRWVYIKHCKQYFLQLMLWLSETISLKDSIEVHSENCILYSYWLNEWGIRLAIYKKLFNPNIKLISRIHGYDFDEIQLNNSFHPYRNFVLSQYNKIVSVSDYGKNYIQNKFKSYNQKLFTSYLGIKDSNQLSTIDNAYSIVSCSAVIELKRIDLIIDILKYIQIPIKWIHFGDGILLEQMKDKSKELPTNIQVEWKGQVDNQAILSYYKNNSICLLINTSDYEGLPYSMIEAISFGIPICGRNVCGIPEIVNEQTGILIDIDIEKTANQISDFLMHKSLNSKFRENVKAYWNLNFNADVNYPHFIKNYLN